MTERTRDNLQKWLPTLGTFVAIGIAWGLLTAAVERKADLTDVQALQHEARALNTKVDALVRMACRADPKDSICPYK